MMKELNLLKVLLHPTRRQILQECTNVDIAFGILERKLGISHNALWRHIAILEKAKLIQVYKYQPEDYRKLRHYIGGRPYFKLVTPKITKTKIKEIDKEIKEIKELVEEANIKFEKIWKDPKKRKIYKGIK